MFDHVGDNARSYLGHFFIILGSLFGHVRGHFFVTFWSCRGHFFVIFGTCWDVFWDTFGRFSDRFGKVSGKSSAEVEKTHFSKVSGSIFPASGRSKQSFLAYSRTENTKKNQKSFVLIILADFSI